MPGRPAVTRYVDVAAEDNLSVTLTLPPPAEPSEIAASRHPADSPGSARSAARDGSGATLRAVGWIASGALAAGAATFGVLANRESDELKRARDAFPTTAATLNHDASLTTTYSVAADVLAGAAIVVGGITLYWTLSSAVAGPPKRGGGDIRVMLSPSRARLEMTF